MNAPADPPSGDDAGTKDDRVPASKGASSAFAPANPTDNRALYDYASRWPENARKAQRGEGIYLAVLGVLSLGALLGTLLATNVADAPRTLPCLSAVFFTGLLGGTVFSVKWWYHSIARGIWHVDRRAWRIAVPWQGAIVAMFMHVLFKSDLLGILNPAALDKIHNILAFGFIVGYFSDSAIAKLAEIADSLFGTTRGGREK